MQWWRTLLSALSNPATARLDRALGSTEFEDRCIGSLLGCAVGDILGANVEFQSRVEIQKRYGRVTDFLRDWRPLGVFTDDTEMTLALAVSLVECGCINARHCGDSYARFFVAEPQRGYGPSVSHVLSMLHGGSDYRETGRAIQPEGSYANGGAMRIAPVGLAYRNADDAVLHEAVRLALRCTHVHPDAVDGAFVQAKAIATLALTTDPTRLDVTQFLANLQSVAESEALRNRLRTIRQAKAEGWSDEQFLSAVCTPNKYGEQFQIHAAEAVACALWAFAASPESPEECIIRAVGLGGDTDTVGAMTGALAGALHGSSWLPRRWFDRIENAPGIGRDYLVGVAKELSKLDQISIVGDSAPPTAS